MNAVHIVVKEWWFLKEAEYLRFSFFLEKRIRACVVSWFICHCSSALQSVTWKRQHKISSLRLCAADTIFGARMSSSVALQSLPWGYLRKWISKLIYSQLEKSRWVGYTFTLKLFCFVQQLQLFSHITELIYVEEKILSQSGCE